MKHRPSTEFKGVIECHAPTPPRGISLREWFAGLALGNVTLMAGVDPSNRPAEAIRIADQLLLALAAPRVPTLASMELSKEALQRWDDQLASKEHRERTTAHELRGRARVPSRKTIRGLGPRLVGSVPPAQLPFGRYNGVNKE